MQIIAEVKTHSPFGWDSPVSWDELFSVAEEFGDIISVHTDSRWHGSFELISKARNLTKKPVLAKGIHAEDFEIQKALDAGADFVLVVGRTPAIHIDKCLIEPYSLEELSQLSPDTKVVWNSRDLSTGGLKKETFMEAKNIFNGWICQASNIKTLDDIYKNADAILVGSNLVNLAKERDLIKNF